MPFYNSYDILTKIEIITSNVFISLKIYNKLINCVIITQQYNSH